jgi:hypothetical protein
MFLSRWNKISHVPSSGTWFNFSTPFSGYTCVLPVIVGLYEWTGMKLVNGMYSDEQAGTYRAYFSEAYVVNVSIGRVE